MINCIVVDDEKPARDLIIDNIQHVPYLELVGECKNVFEALEVLQHEKLDLIFLDIQMPGVDGLQFIKTLIKPPMIILTTAYQDYALEAFEHRVVDYLLKPFALSRFVSACNRAKDEFDLRKQKTDIDNDTPEHFFLHVEYRLVKIEWRKIRYVQGLKDYLKIYLEDNTKPIMTRMSMKSIMDKLPARYFIRIHKSYIINISKVSSLNKNFIFIDKIEVPVGESYKDNLSRIIDQGI